MIKSAADIRVFLANELPCFTNDSDEDDFIFIVRAEDIERVALKLWRSLTPTTPDTEKHGAGELGMPKLLYIGDEYPNVLLEKVAIDWSSRKIRGSLPVKAEDNHPNIKRSNQKHAKWFTFDDIGKTLQLLPAILY